MSIYGYTTKRDLTKLGSFLMMGLIVHYSFFSKHIYEIINDVFCNLKFGVLISKGLLSLRHSKNKKYVFSEC